MESTDTVFAGSIPDLYDRYMVPLLFAPYARIVAERAQALEPRRIVETACGTGIVTEAMHERVPGCDIVATDLNEAMIAKARERVSGDRVAFEVADALDLPYPDKAFDLAVCQFGIMFFPDKVAANREARRVLRDGGRYLLVIWDELQRNPATAAVAQAVGGIFPDHAARFYERVPFAYFDRERVESDLHDAGFAEVEIETVELVSSAPSARDAAIGLVQGTPMRSEIESIDPALLGKATESAARALECFEGPDGLEAPMSALFVTATG